MPSMPWFPLYYKDFLLSKKVVKMNHTQKGAYVELLCQEWDDPMCSLPARLSDLKDLIQWKGTPEEFKLIRSCFAAHPVDRKKLHNARLFLEWMKAEEKRQAAKSSAQARWQKIPSNGPSNTLTKPVQMNKDRTTKGLESIENPIAAIADKWFPPQ